MFGLLSIRAIARQIGTIVVRSSAESELCGLPGRTKACVLDPDALGRLSTELAECWNVVWSLMLSRQLL